MDLTEKAKLNAAMLRLSQGDRAAFDTVFEILWPILQKWSAILTDSHEKEDVAQEVLLKIFSQVSKFDPEKEALGWALAIAKFEFMTARKKRVRRKEVSTSDFEAVLQPNHDDSFEKQRVDKALDQIISSLNPLDQQTIRDYLERSDTTASATVRKRLQRAIQRIKNAWSEAYG